MTTNATRMGEKRRQYHRIVNGFYAVGVVSLLLGLLWGACSLAVKYVG